MGFLNSQVRKGFLIGLGIPAAILGFAFLRFEAIEKVVTLNMLTGLIALAVLPNALFFFLALRKKNEAFAYGVLSSCILWALLTFGVKLFG